LDRRLPEQEARTILGFLRVNAKGGRPPGKPTTADGRLIVRACARLNIHAKTLAKKIGVSASALSYARSGRNDLSETSRNAIEALLKQGTQTRGATRR
jgi:hypothetical protein